MNSEDQPGEEKGPEEKPEEKPQEKVEQEKMTHEETEGPPEDKTNYGIILASIAVVLSVAAVSISLYFVFSAKKEVMVERDFSEQLSQKLDPLYERVTVIEGKMMEADKERSARGIIELRKILLRLQEVKALFTDEEILGKIRNVENEIRTVLAVPVTREIEVEEGKEEQPVAVEVKPEAVEEPVEETVEPATPATEAEGTLELEVVEEPADEEKPEGIEQEAGIESTP